MPTLVFTIILSLCALTCGCRGECIRQSDCPGNETCNAGKCELKVPTFDAGCDGGVCLINTGDTGSGTADGGTATDSGGTATDSGGTATETDTSDGGLDGSIIGGDTSSSTSTSIADGGTNHSTATSSNGTDSSSSTKEADPSIDAGL